MSRADLLAAQTAALEHLALLRKSCRSSTEDSENAMALADARQMLRQTSVRLVLLQKSYTKVLQENAMLIEQITELRRIMSCSTTQSSAAEIAFTPPVEGLFVSSNGASSNTVWRRKELFYVLAVIVVALLVETSFLFRDSTWSVHMSLTGLVDFILNTWRVLVPVPPAAS